ncbi:hypothetical protein [Oceanirhabdus sp. W0125-5]|uniref:hypothetical protein n=1 Tax=Oceanirhabdus sp. W0125-5 TaxID=2999116 RepID=UPI0022F314B9|nr:hypothetical protein [Oceanirhabdus sp. W0125-5]WBW96486.1 hypothetical protein OW730_22740 [Oceanirhabdus sp. W0125-5]
MKTWFRVGVMLISLMFTCSVIFADIPDGTVVIGDQGYSLKYANDINNLEIVKSAISDMGKDGKIYIKSFNGSWYANNGEKVEGSIVPKVIFRDNDGQVVTYEAGDGERISENEFKVLNVSFLDSENVEIIFSEAVKNEDYSERIKLSGYLEVESTHVVDEGRRVIATLKNKMGAKVYEGTISILADIENVDGIKLAEEFNKELIVINKSAVSDKNYDKNVSIIALGFIGENLNFNSGVTISGNNSILKNSTADEIAVNPGEEGSVTLESVKAENMNVYSGASHSINIKKCEIDELQVISQTSTRIHDIGESKIKSTLIKSDAILDSEEGAFENVRLVSSAKEKKLKLKGKFKKVVAEENSFVFTDDNAQVEEVLVKGKAKVEGRFSTLNVEDEKCEVEILGNTRIKKFFVKRNNLVKISGYAKIDNIDGETDKISEVKEKLNKAKQESQTSIPAYRNIKLEVKDIKANLLIKNKPYFYNGIKYNLFNMKMDLSNLTLADSEKLYGLAVSVFDEYGNIINTLQIVPKDNKLECNSLYLKNKRGKIILETTDKGRVEFVIK